MSRMAVVSILLEDQNTAKSVNDILHNYSLYIVGRMGIPYQRRNLNIICVVLDAPNDVVSAVSGKLGRLQGVTTKTLYSKEFIDE